ncbi:uncharacterized protein BX664DRAFT_343729 [Halteromyces radiatus]|uniref:uncharacterized protein n=1 Tax=Halteromyces radiatus TaxID=101107 RepID=UPI00221F4FD3|nr:uncharacterized protein BX664DRAFT_343729 [Halteromyces radiatus]KAI8077885.1 hypothetical protein BX664DRAFT_343729 [Halteromyces radiatus]
MPAERKPIVMQTKKTNIIYENWKVYSLHNKLMFRCNEKKANWYLKRNLAKLIPGERTIQLTFEAKGNGHKEGDYMVEERINTCVACNATELLTMHHVVPEMYRRAMPLSIKSKSSRDILLLCKQCHHLYEDKATQLKKELMKQYDCPLEGKGWINSAEKRQVRKAATALLRFEDKIPQQRRDELILVVKEYYDRHENQNEPISYDDDGRIMAWKTILEQYSRLEDVYRGPDFIDHGTCVIRQLMEKGKITSEDGKQERWPELENFIKLWRQHFLDHLEPKYLSASWTVNGEIYNH